MFTALLALCFSAHAATLAGVTLPDSSTVGGQPVTLNGLGLREKFLFDIYVGGLYLTKTTHDGAAAIAADEPKKVVMHFVYSKVTHQQMIDSFEEQFGQLPAAAAQRANIEKIESWVPAEITAGKELIFEYTPGVGTSMFVGSQKMGTIPGTDFMKLVFSIYVGPHPPTEDLKRGMLGL